MLALPLPVQEGWTQKGGHPKEDDEAGPASWEGWESRLKEERVPGYVVAEIFGKVSDEIRATYAEATQPFEVLSTLSVGQEPSTEPMAAAAMPVEKHQVSGFSPRQRGAPAFARCKRRTAFAGRPVRVSVLSRAFNV